MLPDHLRTPFGKLQADICTTFHVPWAGGRPKGKLGMADVFRAVYGRGANITDSGSHVCIGKKLMLTEPEELFVVQSIASGIFPSAKLDVYITDLVNKNVLPAGVYVITT